MKRSPKRWRSELYCENSLIFCIQGKIFTDILLTVAYLGAMVRVFQPKRASSRMTLRLPVGLLHIFSLVFRDGC